MKTDAFHKRDCAEIRHLRSVQSRDTQCFVVSYLCDDAVGFQQLSIALNNVEYLSNRGTWIACEKADPALQSTFD